MLRLNFSSLVFLLCYVSTISKVAQAELTDATKSLATGSGLQYATAGVLAQFTVTAKDESGVRRTSGGDDFVVELEGTRSVSGSVIDNLDGTYPVSYTITKSGNYEGSVQLATNGGLSMAYYENMFFFYTPVKTGISSTINHVLKLEGSNLTLPAAQQLPKDFSTQYISLRWGGKIQPSYSEAYTFFVTSNDGSKLWVDNVLLIDCFDFGCNDTSGTIALMASVLYPIKLEYKQLTGDGYVSLSWQSRSLIREVVGANSLYYTTDIRQSPFSVIVAPNVANGSRSTAAGDGLFLATAGTAAHFTLQANDQYDNERGEGGDVFSVRVQPVAGGRPVHASVVDETDSTYLVEYTPFKAFATTISADLLNRGGVSATYYAGAGFATPVKATAAATVATQKIQFATGLPAAVASSIASLDQFSVRYAGQVPAPLSITYSRPRSV